MKLILDTSTLLAMLLSSMRDNTVRQLLTLVKKNSYTFIVSDQIIQELKSVINSNKYKNHPNYNPRNTAKFINYYQHNSKFINHTKVNTPKVRDQKDIIFLELALISKADYLISLDKDLLEIKKVGECRILKPADFLKEYSVVK